MTDDLPTCRLYLTTPPELISGGVAVSAFADLLQRAIDAADIACLRIAGSDTARVAVIARELMEIAQSKDVAVLLDDAELVEKLGADGVHLDDPAPYAQARQRLGPDRIVGVGCPLERHAAMDICEVGADYVQFPFPLDRDEEALDLIAWWNEVMTVPSVVPCPPSDDIARQIVASGADFLAPDVALWGQADPIKSLAGLLG